MEVAADKAIHRYIPRYCGPITAPAGESHARAGDPRIAVQGGTLDHGVILHDASAAHAGALGNIRLIFSNGVLTEYATLADIRSIAGDGIIEEPGVVLRLKG